MFPPGIDKDNLHDIQKDFIVYLVASIPTMEDLSLWLQFEAEKGKIMKRDFMDEIETIPEVLEMSAVSAGITVEEYKRRQTEKLRDDEIEKLREKFGYNSEEDEDDRLKVLRHYRDIAENLKNSEDWVDAVKKTFGEVKEDHAEV